MISISPLLIVYLVLFLTGVATESVLTKMNMGHFKHHGHRVPDLFKGYIDGDKLRIITDYTVDNEQFDLFTSWITSALFLFVILSGLLPWFVKLVETFGFGVLASAMIFFATLAVVQGVFSLPFNYYKTFVIEQRYGFNTSTFKTWVTDILKAVVVGAIIGGILLGSVLLLVEHGGSLWWLWAWLVFFGFQLLLLVLYPTLIAPWFNKFLPLEDKALEEQVKRTMERGGLAVEGVFKMDAGKRSRHTNAYFTGLGKAKRIVLFDTLLTSHSHDEIVAILAHEVGHWKKRHLHKNLFFVSLVSLLLFYTASRLLTWPTLYQTFGFDHGVSYVGLFLVGVLWEAVGQFFGPLGAAISRRFEREADSYAAQLLKQPADLISALKRLASDNLSNLYPHPLYAWFYYSHPPLAERIQRLEAMAWDSPYKLSVGNNEHSH
ncbi:MAG: M48 family metallopeptidase [Thermodesulfobacteriota bacterium]|nr:M48 family metallopeptidase [Thermodesulfobacteriota bacterium]